MATAQKSIPIGVPDIDEDEVQEVTKVVRAGWIARGNELEEFESEGKDKEEDLSGLLGEEGEDVENLEDEEEGKDTELEFFGEEKPVGKKKKTGQK